MGLFDEEVDYDDGCIILKPQPVQEAFMASTADIAIYGGSAGSGKGFQINELIQTPTGPIRIGDISDGDDLIDESGNICRVVKAHDPYIPEVAYRLTFDDGSTVECCKDHLWLTFDAKELNRLTRVDEEWKARRRANRPSRATWKRSAAFTAAISARNSRDAKGGPPPCGSVKNTQQIFETLKTPSGRSNHAIPVCKAWELPEADLLLDPYLLGVWLGDGWNKGGQITKPEDEIRQQFIDIGFDCSEFYKDGKTFTAYNLAGRLRRLGVFGDKHIPAAYLRASKEQRMALLQGLLDTDGYPNKQGNTVEYSSSRKQLAEQAFELAISLGFKATLRTKRAQLNGKDYGDTYTVAFSTKERVFRLSRKHDIHQSGGPIRRTNNYRYIVGCDRIEPVEMRCLTVDSPSRLFLVGKSAIPTHNTYSLLLEAARNIDNPEYGAVIFRREQRQIMSEGGLKDTAINIYLNMGADFRSQPAPMFRFPSGARVTFSYINQDVDVRDWQGSQIAMLGFDELTHMSKYIFFYMLSRNRSTCGIRPYVRATCNPDPDSWVASFIGWWIDPNTGYPIKERSGKLRWFVRIATADVLADDMHWGDSAYEVAEKLMGISPSENDLMLANSELDIALADGEDIPDNIASDTVRFVKLMRSARSVTFISATIYDNQALLCSDPGYLANLKSLNRVERAQLLDGNWKIAQCAGQYFPSKHVNIIPEMPKNVVRWIRSWDLAATEPNELNLDPDWTVGLLIGRQHNGRPCIGDVVRIRRNAKVVRDIILATALRDGKDTFIRLPQDPNQAGKAQFESFLEMLAGYSVFSRNMISSKNKETMAEPCSAVWLADGIDLVLGDWNKEFLAELEVFPRQGFHDDQVDALTSGFALLPPVAVANYSAGVGLSNRFKGKSK